MTRLAPASENLLRTLDGANAAAHLDGQPFGNLLDECGVIALAHRCIQVDQLYEWKTREALDPVFKVIEGEAEFLALHELDDAPAQQINRRNQHGSLTGTPA